MNAIDEALRDMLHARAQDIRDVPAHLLEVADAPPARSHRTAWLVAASAAIVLGVGAATVALQSNGSQHTVPSTHSSSPTPTPTPTTHVRRDASLSWFGMTSLPGWKSLLRTSEPGSRTVGLRKVSDTGIPIGCNGCEMATVFVTVFDRAGFDATKSHVRTWKHTTVSGQPAYLGTMKEIGGRYVVPTLAWQYQPDTWALVQGVTPVGGRSATLHTVAAAVRPDESTPLSVPFTLDFVPDLPVTNVMDDRSEGYAASIQLGTITGREFDITVWPGEPSNPPTVKHTAANRREIGGRIGYYDRSQGVADIPIINGQVVEIGISRQDSQLNSLPLTATDRRDMDRVLAGIHWTNGDGSAPYATAEDAVP